jgi:uncharacterized protein with PIN domain
MKQDSENLPDIKGTKVQFRVYAELNDFLRADRRQVVFEYFYHGPVTIREAIESLGIPHSSVDLVLVNGEPVDFDCHLVDNDFISVYPVFELLDISTFSKIRKDTLRNIRFIVDAHLGKLAKNLRIMGFDALYRNNYTDNEIRLIARLQHRIILTKDKGLLMAKNVARGYYVRSVKSKEQTTEVVRKFDLYSKIDPLSRCLICNRKLAELSPAAIPPDVLDNLGKRFEVFYKCLYCKKIFWKGSHYKSMAEAILQYIK